LEFLNKLLFADEDSASKEHREFILACKEAEFLLPESINIKLRILKSHVRGWNNVRKRIDSLQRSETKQEELISAQEEINNIENKIEEMGEEMTDVFMPVLKFEKF